MGISIFSMGWILYNQQIPLLLYNVKPIAGINTAIIHYDNAAELNLQGAPLSNLDKRYSQHE